MDYNLLFDYIHFTITRLHNLLVIYSYLSIAITHEEKRVHTQPENGKGERKRSIEVTTRSGSKGKRRTVQRLKCGVGLEFWK